MKTRTGNILFVIGLCFIVFYLVVRLFYIVDISEALAKAQVYSIKNTSGTNVTGYLITYIVWSYSFKLGAFLAITGCALNSGMRTRNI